MAIKTILDIKDPGLRELSAEVTDFASIKELIQDLHETLAADKTGVGLSAIQIGVDLRVFVTNHDGIKKVYVNPQWLPSWEAEQIIGNEGCLSDKGNFVKVKRYKRIHISYQDENGKKWTDKLSNLKARCYQHEADHLDGLTLLDRALIG